MKNLAIIGASYLQLPLIKKAKEMGFTTHVFAWQCNDVGEQEADFFYPISITEVDEIAEKCREIGVCGICSIATDLGNYTVNYVANRLGLPGNGINCAKISTNKFLMREAFFRNGDPIPKYWIVDETTDLNGLDLLFPIIVKPTDRSGSRGVTKIDNRVELMAAIKKSINESFEKKAIVEEYVDGKEYSVEGISYDGHHTILAVTEKRTTGAPYFIETGHKEPAKLNSEQYHNVVDCVVHALTSLEIRNSASHSEVKIDDNGKVKIIEIGSRMGGDCIGSDLVKYSTGIDYVKAVIQVACGEKPNLTPEGDICEAEVRYIISEEDLMEFERIKASDPRRILRVVDDRHFDNIGKTTDSSNRCGCYIIRNNV